MSLITIVRINNEQWSESSFIAKHSFEINEVQDFECNIRKIFNKMSSRFNKYSDKNT